MKKFLLSFFTILLFAVYVVYQRLGSGSSGLVQPPMMNGGSMMNNGGGMMVNYRDGEYAGVSADAYYGRVQVSAVITGGRIVDVKFLDYPKDHKTSQEISRQATPLLKTEAIVAQNANVDIVSGATQTSEAFQQSLASALAQAKS